MARDGANGDRGVGQPGPRAIQPAAAPVERSSLLFFATISFR